MPKNKEHFATLFDHQFLLQGLCLYRSLAEHAGPFHLWILCIDEEVEQALRLLNLPAVTLLPLRSVETAPLLAVKNGKTIGEYCWTLTPFISEFVFARAPGLARVTYLDSDLFFFGSPDPVFDEFEGSARHVLIMEHAYAPEYAFQLPLVGRFCVQFMTFRNTPPAREVSAWWQARCLEWCFARAGGGRFGGQTYRDDWPQRFTAQVHVFKQMEKAIGPWNALHFERMAAGRLRPVFFHFQGLRVHPGRRVTLYSGYRVGPGGRNLYRRYLEELKRAARDLDERGIRIAGIPRRTGFRAFLIRLKRLLGSAERYATLR